MKYINVVLCSMLIGLCSLTALAGITPQSVAADSRIRVVPYQKNNVVTVTGSTFVSTQVVFSSSEHIVDIQGGDAAAWTVNVDKLLPNILNLKPTMLNSNTNMTVITSDDDGNNRIYYFYLISVAAGNKQDDKATYAVQFLYPDESRDEAVRELQAEDDQKNTILNATSHPASYNWDYSFNGDKTLIPLHMFDDGKFTYLELRDNQVVPAIFAVHKSDGNESVVNYRRAGDYLVIEQISPQYTLRNGSDSVASLFNNALITKLNNS